MSASQLSTGVRALHGACRLEELKLRSWEQQGQTLSKLDRDPLSFFAPYAKHPAHWARGNNTILCLHTYARSSGHWHKCSNN